MIVSLCFKWLLPVGVKPTYCHVSLASQLLCQITGHPTGKSPLWLDKHLHKCGEISEESNPALPSIQRAYFRKSTRSFYERGTAQRKAEQGTYRIILLTDFLTSCVWIMEVGVQAFFQKPWNLFSVPLLHILHKLLQVCLMEKDKGVGRGGRGGRDSCDWVM